MIGNLLDNRYEITDELGEGGFGKIYLAQDTKRPGNPNCLVKQLHPKKRDPASLQKAFEMFEKEAKVLERLKGKCDRIPALLAYFQENGEFYLVQDYIQGDPLSRELLPGQPWQEDKVIQLLIDILEPLEVVHQHNVIHRDIKPDNIMRQTEDNQLFLIDFGAVKEVVTLGSNTTVAIYTPGYGPPEQLIGKPELSSDIYAVGMIAIQALMGISHKELKQLPKDNNNELVWQDKAKVSPDFGYILEKMVRFNAKERYATAKEALAAVKRLLEPAITTQPLNPPQNRPWGLVLLGILALSASIGAMLFLMMNKSGQELPLDGVAIEGSLTKADRTYMDLVQNINTYADYYFIVGKQGQTVTIEMTSSQIDPYLVLRDRQGKELVFNDDISTQDSNARIEITLPEDGNYTVIARSFESGESGNYKIWAVGD
jgi:serine/threonine-protein kinase